MKRFPFGQVAAAALTALGLLLSVACVQRIAGTPAGLAGVSGQVRVPAGVSVVQGPPGALKLAIPFPAIGQGRRSQYAYDSGYVYSVELHLYDSQGNYQNFLVVRNTDNSDGLAAGTASVTFSNVPPGLCTLSAHTTQKQYYGSVGSGSLIEPSPTEGNNAYTATGIAGVVRSLYSDALSPFLVFRSNDITGGGADGAPTSVLFAKDTFKTRNGLDKEMFDTTAVSAGYGIGAATASIAPASTTVINITVTQPPVWATALYDTVAKEFATVSAGVDSTISAPSFAVAGDMVLIASGSLSLSNGDVLDLKDLPEKGTLCTIAAGSMSIPAAIQAGTYTVYPVRGSIVSRIGEIGGKVPPKLVVLPGAIASARATFAMTDDELAAAATTSVTVSLFDAAGNPIKQLDGITAGLNDGATMSATVVPTAVATLSTYLVGGKTYGSLPAFPRTSTDGRFAATLTQGAIASSASGSAGATTVTSVSGRVIDPGLTLLYLPNDFAFAAADTITLLASDSAPALALKLGTNSTTFASRTDFPTINPIRIDLPVLAALTAQVGNFAPLVAQCQVQTDGNLLTAGDDGTTFTFASYGQRKVGDTDRVDITVLSSDSTVVATSSITVTWK